MGDIRNSKTNDWPYGEARFGVTDRAWIVSLLFFGSTLPSLAFPIGELYRGLLGNALSICLVLWLAGLDRKALMDLFGGKPTVGWTSAGLAYGVAAYAAAPLWGHFLPDPLGPTAAIPWVVDAPWVAAFTWVATSAIAEEAFFRGYLLPRFGPGDERRAILTAAVLFAVVHLRPAAWPQLFIDGVVYGLLRVRSGSLLPPVLAHGLYNALVFASWRGAI